MPRWTPARPQATAVAAVSGARGRELAAAAGEEADPVTTALTTERHRALNAALATITDDQRAAIVLFDVEGYDYAEIAVDDRRLPRHREVPDPSRPPGAPRPPRERMDLFRG